MWSNFRWGWSSNCPCGSGTRPRMSSTHPLDIKHILVTNQDNYRKVSVPPVELGIFGHGVLHSEGETHHRQPHLWYTKMIWGESLRLYPPVWSLHTRVGRDEDRLPSGTMLPPGAWVFISPWSVHRNARWFPDPNRFDPERFSEEAKRTYIPYSHILFGNGGRRCLGESFAELEGLLILATIASRFQLRLIDGQTILPDPVMTLRPNRSVRIIVRRIDIHRYPLSRIPSLPRRMPHKRSPTCWASLGSIWYNSPPMNHDSRISAN